MRDEFYSQLAATAPALMRRLERGLVNMPVTLGRGELAAMITEPAGQAGIAVEPGLPEAIVGDAVRGAPVSASSDGEVDAAPTTVLPLLEFALAELWEARADGVLTRERYRQLGGLAGVLAGRRDQAFDELADHDQTHRAPGSTTPASWSGATSRRMNGTS